MVLENESKTLSPVVVAATTFHQTSSSIAGISNNRNNESSSTLSSGISTVQHHQLLLQQQQQQQQQQYQQQLQQKTNGNSNFNNGSNDTSTTTTIIIDRGRNMNSSNSNGGSNGSSSNSSNSNFNSNSSIGNNCILSGSNTNAHTIGIGNNNHNLNGTIANNTTNITGSDSNCITPNINNNYSDNTGSGHQQQQQQQRQQHLNSSNNSNNNCNNNNGSNNSNNGNNSTMSNKSETSSNASLNGSIKKTSPGGNHFMNSREDITSLGGASSVNSQSQINNINSSSNLLKETKENPHHCFNNGGSSSGGGHPIENAGDDDGLGPLPPKWEMAYTENGELYFIDHNTGTSHWLDPRLSKFQKKSLEDCQDDELPYGWEKIHDPQYGTYFIDHVNRRTQYENPVLEAKRRVERTHKDSQRQIGMEHHHHHHHLHPPQPNQPRQILRSENQQRVQNNLPYTFTRNPAEMRGERITTTLLKSSRGLGITIIGGDEGVEEFLQIKSIVPNGPAWLDGKLETGDILVYVNDTCVLGFTHHEMVNVFQSILPGETVTLEVCRGYSLPFDPNDPDTEVVTTIAVDGINSDPEKSRLLMDLNMDGNYNFLDISDPGGVVGDGTGLQKNSLSKIQSANIRTMNNNELSTSGAVVNSENGGDECSMENYIGDDVILYKKPEILNISITKGIMGFGFTIADSSYGQKVKKILDRNCCKNLQESDILLEINNTSVKHLSHSEVVQVLKDCPKTQETVVKVQRGHHFYSSNANMNYNRSIANKLRKTFGNSSVANGGTDVTGKSGLNGSGTHSVAVGGALYRSKTPTADLYSTQTKEVLPIRPKTPLVDTRRARMQSPSNELNEEVEAVTSSIEKNIKDENNIVNDDNKSSSSIPIADNGKLNSSLHESDSINNDIPYMDPFPKLVTSLSERLAEASIIQDNRNNTFNQNQHHVDSHATSRENYENAIINDYNSYSLPHENASSVNYGNFYSPPAPCLLAPVPTYHQEPCYCFECQDYNRYQQHQQHQSHQHQNQPSDYYGLAGLPPSRNMLHSPVMPLSSSMRPLNSTCMPPRYNFPKHVNESATDRRPKTTFTPLECYPPGALPGPLPYNGQQQQQQPPFWKYGMSPNSIAGNLIQPVTEDEFTLSEVTLERQALGFGFRIVGGTEEGSQVTVGHIVPGGAADGNIRIATGDEILSIDGVNVVNASHHKVVSLMGEAALRGQVTMILRRRRARMPRPHSATGSMRRYPYDVIISRNENEGFGFVIISSSNQFYGSTIGKLILDSPADRCGELKVGDRIIAVNRIDIIGMSHGDVVNLIKDSGLHVRLTIGCPKEGNSLIRPPTSTSLIAPVKPLEIQNPQQLQSAHPQSHPYGTFEHSQLTQNPQL